MAMAMNFNDDFDNFRNHNQIEGFLYLGNIWSAINSTIMKQLKINVVITVMDGPLKSDEKFDGIEYHFIDVVDCPAEDILSHFPFAYKIISKAEQECKNVYVHCAAGISQSATIVISYLMKKYKMKADQAEVMVKKRRKNICPNQEFKRQLKLYEKWGYELDAKNREYRNHLVSYFIFRLRYSHQKEWEKIWNKIDMEKTATNYFGRIKQIDNKLSQCEKGEEYKCEACKTVLFYKINLIQNIKTIKNICGKFFVEPQEWMLENIDGKAKFNKESTIRCFKCKNKIGKFSLTTFTCVCYSHYQLSDFLVVEILEENLCKNRIS